MNQVSTTAAADTPAMRLREAVESAGFRITGVPDDLTSGQALDVALEMQRQVRLMAARA